MLDGRTWLKVDVDGATPRSMHRLIGVDYSEWNGNCFGVRNWTIGNPPVLKTLICYVQWLKRWNVGGSQKRKKIIGEMFIISKFIILIHCIINYFIVLNLLNVKLQLLVKSLLLCIQIYIVINTAIDYCAF